MTTENVRYNNFDQYRPPLAFGVRWDFTDSDPTTSFTRVGDAADMTVNNGVTPHDSDFDDYWPWGGMQRMRMSPNGDIDAIAGETDVDGNTMFIESGAGAKIMVRIPKFWFKFVETDTYYEYWISSFPLPEYRMHPAFQRGLYYGDDTNGQIEFIYVAAYEGFNAGGLLSVANETPTCNQTRAAFRVLAQTIGLGYTLMDYTTWSAIQWLYLIEYASWDSQTMIGPGLTQNVVGAVSKTGWTGSGGPSGSVDLGNGTGQVQVSGADYANSYRGLENLWGNTWTILDGINIRQTDPEIWTLEDDIEFVDQTPPAAPYRAMRVWAPTSSGWIKTPVSPNVYREARWSMWPSVVSGGSDTTYTCDYYTVNASWTTPTYPAVGGVWNSGSAAGLFTVNCGVMENYSAAHTGVGVRMMLVPFDNTGFYVY